jgi:hypothetical protein
MVRKAKEVGPRRWPKPKCHAPAALRGRLQRGRAAALHDREDGRGDDERQVRRAFGESCAKVWHMRASVHYIHIFILLKKVKGRAFF